MITTIKSTDIRWSLGYFVIEVIYDAEDDAEEEDDDADAVIVWLNSHSTWPSTWSILSLVKEILLLYFQTFSFQLYL